VRSLEERVALLRRHVPGLWEPGRVLYVGAAPKRFQLGAELIEAGHQVTILEAWEPYAELYRARGFEVIGGDVRTWVPVLTGTTTGYDVAVWWHGPEHVRFEEVGPALARLEAAADLVVIGCPWGNFPQEMVDGNPYQEHRCALYPEDLRRWGYRVAAQGMRDARGQGYLVGWKDSRFRGNDGVVRAVVIAFNEERLLPGCLESVHGQVDEIVVVDGAYAQFPHTVPWSTDKTRQIAEAYGCRWIGCETAWPGQVEKRSAYLVGQEGDWYVHVDADERLCGVLPELVDGRHYALRVASRTGHESWSPRIWQHKGHMRYEGSHNALWSDGELVHLRGVTHVPAEECRLLHLAGLREPERQRDKAMYYAWQKPAERPYRRAHGI